MPKNIAVFCDGTWNKSDAPNPTNVVRLAQAVRNSQENNKERQQVVIYVEGVGTGRGAGKIAKKLDKVLGGVFGWGLLENIKEAYRAIVFNYQPGDQIFLFGFSRGAYTARSLAGLIRKSGILPRENIHLIDEAIELYKKGGGENKPDAPHILRERQKLSPQIATSNDDQAARDGDVPILRIAYLGVWDTVGALGVPSAIRFLAKPINKKYGFHDHDLSSSVAMARHAVSIDETRKTFPPTLWQNLDQLNQRFPAEIANYQELWFAGDHAAVGGGGEAKGLSRVAMDFIAEGAARAGLDIDDWLLNYAPTSEDACGRTDSSKDLSLAERLLRKWKTHRSLPNGATDVAEPVLVRIALMGRNYIPKTLVPHRGDIVKRANALKLTPPTGDASE